jgi:2-keto-3-deoxy-6-phosphogluconate aldolase
MKKAQKLDVIRETGVIAIMRAQSSDQLIAAADFIRKGAAALGVGSGLINQKLLDAGDMAELTRRAERFIEEVKKGRGSS